MNEHSVLFCIKIWTFFPDLSMIPCEFCGDPFVADDLVQHQVGSRGGPRIFLKCVCV